jgi:hypothetical protein
MSAFLQALALRDLLAFSGEELLEDIGFGA